MGLALPASPSGRRPAGDCSARSGRDLNSSNDGGAVSARAQQRREVTARELAARIGSSERTARRLVAEPRSEFLARAAANRARAVELREQGHTYAEIAITMHLPIGSVGKLLHAARKHAATKQGQASA